MAEASEEVHLQATFISKQERFAVDTTPFSLPLSATRGDLTQLIKQLLSSSDDGSTVDDKLQFDFLVDGSLLRKTLGQLIEKLQLETEKVIQIEYIERSPPPMLDKELPHNDWVSAVHCTEEYILTGSYDCSVCIWTVNGELIGQASGHEREISGVSWLPKSCDSHMFVSASHDQHAHIWKFNPKTKESECLYVCKGHSRIIEALGVSEDGTKFCTGGVDKVLKIWPTAAGDTGEGGSGEEEEDVVKEKRARMMTNHKPKSRVPLSTFSGHTHSIMSIKWIGSEKILSAGYDHCIREWDVLTGVNTNTMNGSKVFLSIDKSHDGCVIASGHSDRHVRLWDNRNSSSSMVVSTLSSHSGWVKRVGWAPFNNYQLVSGSYDNTAKLWDTRSPKVPLYTITAHEDKLLSLDWSLPQMIATGGCDNMLRTFHL